MEDLQEMYCLHCIKQFLCIRCAVCKQMECEVVGEAIMLLFDLSHRFSIILL